MTPLRTRLRDRCDDVCDWMDYRPDPNFRPFLAVPILFALTYALSTEIGLALVFFVALALTMVVAIVSLVALLGWIVGAALIDCLSERFVQPLWLRRHAIEQPTL